MSYLESAFHATLKDIKRPGIYYVCLRERVQCYGGPEEGGCWYDNNTLVAWAEYPTIELAESAAEQVKTLANELAIEAQKNYGDFCIRQVEWLEERGLDSDFLPENDGPSQYSVIVTEELPVFDNTVPHYE